jgi:tellurite resistance protein TerC
MNNILSTNPSLLIVFAVLITFMLILDLGVLNKKSHVVSNKEATTWTIVWISLSMLFSGLVYWQEGFEKFAQFQSAYWIEKALSVDNLFVFILVFGFFKLEGKLQHKVLIWGIIGALIFRAIFIFSGVELINMTYLPAFDFMGMHFNLSNVGADHADFTTKTFFRPNIVLTLFGFFLVYAGIKSAFASEEDDEKDFNKGLGAKIIRKIIPVSRNYHGDKFFIRRGTKRFATRLLLVMVVIESTDLIFAVDSIPAIFAIAPGDPFILYTSNIFAILGLRSMYFLLANSIDLFSKLKYGLAFILTFIGLKMLIAPFYHFSSSISLLIVLGVLTLSIVWSVLAKEKK